MDVHADINYLPTGEGPIKTSAWKPRYHGVRDEGTRTMEIRDARGHAGCFDLDVNGFKFVELPPKSRRTESDGSIQSEFYIEVGEILKTL